MTPEQIASLEPELMTFLEQFDHCFRQSRTRQYWQKYMMGLLADIPRKSIEPIALTAGVPVRTLQELLSHYRWDERRVQDTLQRLVADRIGQGQGLGIIDGTGHAKRGDKTPGVKRQWCGETGKVDNCVVAQHLLYTDNHWSNPFSCMLDSDLYLPKEWAQDRDRCRQAGIPDEVVYRPKWQIALQQVKAALGNGIRFSWIVFDSEYGRIPSFWYGLDALGQRAVGEVPKDFRAWATPPAYRSWRSEHASRKVEDLVSHSPFFRQQAWRKIKVKTTTRGHVFLEVRAARVQLVQGADPQGNLPGSPTDRRYWLIATRHPQTGETRYWVSNAPEDADLEEMLRIALARWHVEKWFERAKQEAGLGAFEVRTYLSLLRHWLTCRVAMLFLACQTRRLRGEKSADHAGASGPGSQQPGVENLETMAERMEGLGRKMQILPAA